VCIIHNIAPLSRVDVALQRINFAFIKNWQNFKLPAGVEHFFVMAIISKTTQMGCLFAIQTPLPHEKKKGWVHG
jgi:hypothetical protein